MKKGFSFIELIVSVSVLGILVGVVLMVMNPNQLRAKARDGRRINDLKLIQSGLEQYISSGGNTVYPIFPAGGCVAGTWGLAEDCLSTALSDFIGTFPRDPLTLAKGTGNSACTAGGQANRYNFVSSGSTYILTAVLETSIPTNATPCSFLTNWSSFSASCGGTPLAGCIGVQNPL